MAENDENPKSKMGADLTTALGRFSWIFELWKSYASKIIPQSNLLLWEYTQ